MQDSETRRWAWFASWVLPWLAAVVCARLPPSEAAVQRFVSMAGVELLLVLLAAAYMDATEFRIPNWLTYPAVVWGIMVNGFWSLAEREESFRVVLPDSFHRERLGAVGISDSLAGMAACFGVMLISYRLTARGAGDVKLAAVIGAWLGLKPGVSAVLLAYIVAGGVAACAAIWTIGPMRLVLNLLRSILGPVHAAWISPPSEHERLLLQRPIPFATALAAGTLLVAWQGNLFDGGPF